QTSVRGIKIFLEKVMMVLSLLELADIIKSRIALLLELKSSTISFFENLNKLITFPPKRLLI
ncbi:MAG: hypothetical protein U1C19_10670, partial [Methanobacteriaceae archaeon]|nr:hypothetical protein [Methanobacteriaceae archaeon]